MRRSKNLKGTNNPRVENPRRSYEENRLDFILTELELAITFAEAAASSNSDEKTERNVRHAKRACEGATRFSKRPGLSPEMTKLVDERVEKLRLLFEHIESAAEPLA